MEDLTGMETARIEISFRVGGLAVAFAMNYVKLVKVDAQIQHVDRFAELDFVNWEVNPMFICFRIQGACPHLVTSCKLCLPSAALRSLH